MKISFMLDRNLKTPELKMRAENSADAKTIRTIQAWAQDPGNESSLINISDRFSVVINNGIVLTFDNDVATLYREGV